MESSARPKRQLTGFRVPIRIAGALIALTVVSTGCYLVAQPPPPTGGTGPAFVRNVIDPRDLGADVKAVGDIDGDGDVDVVIGDNDTVYLQWYSAPDWELEIIDARTAFTTDMELGDVDGDGDLDVVVPDHWARATLWYENPAIGGGGWTSHRIGASRAHDLEVGDIDGDGDLDVVVRAHWGATTLFRNEPGENWTPRVLPSPDGEGLALGDLDGDGDLDLGQNGWWLEAPADLVNGTWQQHTLAGGWADGVAARIADVDGDGRNDLLVTPNETAGNLVWYRAPVNPRSGTWTAQTIGSTERVHDFDVADVDLDGDSDIVFAEMHQSSTRRVGWFRNNGDELSWTPQVIASTGSHNIRVHDMDGDGDPDIMGANWSGSPSPIEWWENQAR